VHPEAAFLSGYALLLAGVAAALDRLGRRATDPWSSRMLTASRPAGEPLPHHPPGWPHSEVPTFHLVVGMVALVAALLLTTVSLVRNHAPAEAAAQLVVLVLIGAGLFRLVRRQRAHRARHQTWD